MYVVEFYTSNHGFLENADGTALPDPAQSNFHLRYFVGPANTDCNSYIEYITAPNGCQFNRGRFQAATNCSTTWTYNYNNTIPEQWTHITQTFTAPTSDIYAAYFSPITNTYHSGLELETAYYFLDDVFITPISSNPISATLNIQGNSGPIVPWNGFYQIPLSIFVETDWTGSNTVPITIQLNLPAGLTFTPVPGWIGNTYTFPTGTLNQNGSTLNVQLNVTNAINPSIINEISVTANSGCLNHIPIIGVDMDCTAPQVNFTDFLYCSGNPSILATIVNDTGLIPSGTGSWNWPGPTTSVGMTASNVISGTYIFTYSNGACSQNYNHTIALPTIGSYTVLGATTVNNQTAFDLSGQVVVYTGDVTVNANMTWNVNSSTVLFHSDKRIKILPDGNLSSENSTFDAACPSYWRGIEVQGISTQPEVESPLNSPHGTCVLGACNVKNAYIGVSAQGYGVGTSFSTTLRGGLVMLRDNCNFINNRQDLNFQPTTTSSNYIRKSRILDTNFLLDQSYWLSLGPASRIYHSTNSGVRYARVLIKNTDPQRVISMLNFKAVELVNSKIEFICDINNPLTTTCNNGNTIEGFTYGIHATRTSNFGIGDMRVHNITFKCHRGYYSQGSTGLRSYTINNTFQKLPDNFTTTPNCNTSQSYIGPGTLTYYGRYGAYFQGTHFINIIEGNDFIGTNNIDQLTHVGLVINGNGAINNNVYKNTFTNLSHGLVFYGVNRSTSEPNTIGMRFECNIYNNNKLDNMTTSAGGTASPPASTGLGIVKLQGSTGVSAGNKFTSYMPTNDNDDIREMYNTIQDHTYHYQNIGSTENFNTAESDMSEFTASTMQAHLCPNQYSNLTSGSSQMLYMALKEMHDNLLDGGNTVAVLDEVAMAQYADAIELYYSLSEKSPNLSKEALVATVQKEYELPTMLLTLILQNNPQAAKSEAVKSSLENRLIPLSEWQMTLVNSGLDWKSTVEDLRSEMGQAVKQYYRALANELSAIHADEALNATQKDEAILSLLDDPTWPFNKYHLAGHHAGMGRLAEARIIYESMIAELPEGDNQKLDLQNLLNLMDHEAELDASVPLTTADTEWLTNIYLNELNPISSAKAAGLLVAAGYALPEPLFGTEESQLRSSQVNNSHAILKTEESKWLSLSPNPASDYVVLQFVEAPITNKAIVRITDAQGRVVTDMLVTTKSGLQQLDLGQLASGVYMVNIVDMGYVMQSEKLIIRQ